MKLSPQNILGLKVSISARSFFQLGGNGYVYETFGILKHEPVKPTQSLLDVMSLKLALSAKCTIHDVSVSLFIFLIIILSFLLHCLSVSALALLALLQFLVCAMAGANCKCANKCVGYLFSKSSTQSISIIPPLPFLSNLIKRFFIL